MRTAVPLVVAIVAQAAGNTFLSRGMKLVAAHVPSSAELSPLLLVRGMESPLVWVGILLLLVFLALFLSLLSREDLSFVLPALSFGFVLNVAFARVFLHEPVSAVRWAGTLLIALGVVLVSQTGRRPEPATSAPADAGDPAW